MPPDPPLPHAGGQDARPVSAEGGWSDLMRTLSRTVPARLAATRRASSGFRALRMR